MSIGLLASIKAGISTLTGRLTSTRAGYLDNIQYYTQTRAGYLDTVNTNLNATITSRLAAIKTIRRGTVTVGLSAQLTNTGTDTFTAVDTSKTLLFHLGMSGAFGAAATGSHSRVELTASNTVTATVNMADTTTSTFTVGYLLVEFN